MPINNAKHNSGQKLGKGLAKAATLNEIEKVRIAKKAEEQKKAQPKPQITAPRGKAAPTVAPYRQRRDSLLRHLDNKTVRKAWFTLSHLLLNEGAKVIDMGCDDGEMTYAMAALAPDLTFVGVDKNRRKIIKAKEKYKLKNLSFEIDDANPKNLAPESVDAIINSYILHEVYSGCRYNPQTIGETLQNQFTALKKGGLMFVRDFSRPPPNEMVMIEFPDKPSTGESLAGMSDADLLIWYSARARPKQDPGCGGFFLEELPARVPQTRLFRLPYKWAYEFVMRKDEKDQWEHELPMEYTFFTIREFRKELYTMGARAEYTSPYWEEDIIEERFNGKFRLYDDNAKPLGMPPTCFIAVARKMAERKSLKIEERRPTLGNDSSLKITTMRNEKSGALQEVVSRDFTVSEILPYRIDADNRLKIYLHDGVPRAIANSVPRKGLTLDGKRWSGHMVEAISVDDKAIATIEEFDRKHSVLFARDYLGLKPQNEAILTAGPHYYPAPDYIDEKIQTYYLAIEKSTKRIVPKNMVGYTDRFQAKGQIREFDAQHVLNAIHVGMIPHARLELQIMSLFHHLGIRAENWTTKDLSKYLLKAVSTGKIGNYLRMMSQPDKRFREIKGTIGQLRNIHSTFVEEGKTQGALAGLSAQDLDFVVRDEHTINTVVIIPLTKNMREEVHVGTHISHQPVPQRHAGNGITFSAPSFTLPAHIQTSEEIKYFIAEKYRTAPHCVTKLGESYFAHVGLTQQRIHPYALAAPPAMIDDPGSVFIPISQFRTLWKNTSMSTHMMTVLARSWKYLPSVMKRRAKLEAKQIANQELVGEEPGWIVPDVYDDVPILKPQQEEAPSLNQKIENLKKVVDAHILPPEEEKEILQKIQGFKTKDAETVTPNIKQDVEVTKTNLSAAFEEEIDRIIERLENDPTLDLNLS